jgi:hypothetical protein
MSRSALVRGHGLRTGGRVRACRRGALLGALCLAMVVPARAQTSVGTTFTYQGRLMQAGSPADGTYDFRFQLYDAPDGGAQVGPTVTQDDWFVATGLFTVPLNFGSVFNGQNRFLEVAVRPGSSTGAYETVSGRHPLTPSPMALVGLTAPWTGVTSKPPGFADDVDNDLLAGMVCAAGQVAKRSSTGTWICDNDTNTTYTAGAGGGLALTGTAFSITTAGVTTARLADGAVTNAKLADGSVSNAKILDNAVTGSKIPANAVTDFHIANAAVGTTELADAAVTGSKIAADAIGALQMADNAVGSAEIVDGSVGSAEIASAAVGALEIASGAVGGPEIADGAVGGADIAAGAVARSHIGGTEVALYQNLSECGSTVLTLAATCFTTVCTPGPPQVLFYQCNGTCSAPGPVQCTTTLRGYLLGTAIP